MKYKYSREKIHKIIKGIINYISKYPNSTPAMFKKLGFVANELLETEKTKLNNIIYTNIECPACDGTGFNDVGEICSSCDGMGLETIKHYKKLNRIEYHE